MISKWFLEMRFRNFRCLQHDQLIVEAGLHGEEDTLDYLWRMVVERNERKVLDNIRRVSEDLIAKLL